MHRYGSGGMRSGTLATNRPLAESKSLGLALKVVKYTDGVANSRPNFRLHGCLALNKTRQEFDGSGQGFDSRIHARRRTGTVQDTTGSRLLELTFKDLLRGSGRLLKLEVEHLDSVMLPVQIPKGVWGRIGPGLEMAHRSKDLGGPPLGNRGTSLERLTGRKGSRDTAVHTGSDRLGSPSCSSSRRRQQAGTLRKVIGLSIQRGQVNRLGKSQTILAHILGAHVDERSGAGGLGACLRRIGGQLVTRGSSAAGDTGVSVFCR